MQTEVLENIKQSPFLPQMLEELNWYWQDEQLRRKDFYEWLSPNIKAEWIEGDIIIHSPVSIEHNIVTGNIYSVLKICATQIEKKSFVGIEKILTRFTRNDYEPDICFYKNEKTIKFFPRQNVFPVPDFIVEVVSPSTQKNDREIKFLDYEKHGVKEYWIVDPIQKTVEQYILANNKFELQTYSNNQIHSSVISNFSFPIDIIFDEEKCNEWIRNFKA